jgi:hypothetical protein
MVKLELYALKLLRLGALYVALLVASKIQEADYVEQVYGRGEKPPSLNKMIAVIVAIMALMDLIIIAFVFVGSKVLHVAGDEYKHYVFVESLVYAALVGLMGLIIASIVASKKYFNYKEDGIRCIRATREIIMAYIAPISLSPIVFMT